MKGDGTGSGADIVRGVSEPQSWSGEGSDTIETSTRHALPDEAPGRSDATPASWLAVGAAALVIAVVGVVLVAIGRSPAGGDSAGGAAGRNAAAAVFNAAQQTLAQRGATITVTGKMSAGGRTIPITGSGEVDFATSAMGLTVNMSIGGQSLVEHEVLVGGHLYLGMVIAGQDMSTYTAGRHWIEMPAAAQSAQVGNGDPVAELRMLAIHGSKVKSLGTSTVGATTVTGYEVTPSRQQMQQGMQRTIAAMKLSPAERAELDEALAKLHMGPPTIDVWFGSDSLLRKLRMKMSFSGALSASGVIDMTFGNYGTAVHLSAPSPSDVIGYADFLRLVQSSGVKFP